MLTLHALLPQHPQPLHRHGDTQLQLGAQAQLPCAWPCFCAAQAQDWWVQLAQAQLGFLVFDIWIHFLSLGSLVQTRRRAGITGRGVDFFGGRSAGQP